MKLTDEQKKKIAEQEASLGHQFDHGIKGRTQRLEALMLQWMDLFEKNCVHDEYSRQLHDITKLCRQQLEESMLTFSKKVYAMEKWKKAVEAAFDSDDDKKLLKELDKILAEARGETDGDKPDPPSGGRGGGSGNLWQRFLKFIYVKLVEPFLPRRSRKFSFWRTKDDG